MRVGVIVQSPDPTALARARADLSTCGEVTADLPLVDGFAARVEADDVARLQTAGLQVVPDVELTVPPQPASEGDRVDVSRDTLGVKKLWDQGLRGKGVGIAVIDTGVASHRDLRDRIVAWTDLVHGQKRPYDDHGHGTHVAGIAGGDGHQSKGRYAGMAPEASIVGIKAFDDDGHANASRVIQALQWALDNRQTFNIRVVNLSIGTRASLPWKNDPLVTAVERAWHAGLFVVTATGNKGPKAATVESPGISPSAITVANADTRGTARHDDDRIYRSSGRGPTPIDRLDKPDVCAPGTDINSCDTSVGYKRMTGSSMAAPMVAGCAALLLGAHPQTAPDALKQAFMRSALPLPEETAASEGSGMIDPAAALALLTREPVGEPVP